jgi:hypothetical protein
MKGRPMPTKVTETKVTDNPILDIKNDVADIAKFVRSINSLLQSRDNRIATEEVAGLRVEPVDGANVRSLTQLARILERLAYQSSSDAAGHAYNYAANLVRSVRGTLVTGDYMTPLTEQGERDLALRLKRHVKSQGTAEHAYQAIVKELERVLGEPVAERAGPSLSTGNKSPTVSAGNDPVEALARRMEEFSHGGMPKSVKKAYLDCADVLRNEGVVLLEQARVTDRDAERALGARRLAGDVLGVLNTAPSKVEAYEAIRSKVLYVLQAKPAPEVEGNARLLDELWGAATGGRNLEEAHYAVVELLRRARSANERSGDDNDDHA